MSMNRSNECRNERNSKSSVGFWPARHGPFRLEVQMIIPRGICVYTMKYTNEKNRKTSLFSVEMERMRPIDCSRPLLSTWSGRLLISPPNSNKIWRVRELLPLQHSRASSTLLPASDPRPPAAASWPRSRRQRPAASGHCQPARPASQPACCQLQQQCHSCRANS